MSNNIEEWIGHWLEDGSCGRGEPLARRVERFWDWFVENEKLLSAKIHPSTSEESEEITTLVKQGTDLISENVNFNMGGDYEFTFSVEGWPDLFIIYSYIVSRMPACLKPKWKFYPFNQGTARPFGFMMYGTQIDTGDIMVSAKRGQGGRCFDIRYYEKNLCALPGEEAANAMWVIIENTVGEGVSFEYIGEIEQAESPDGGMLPLAALKDCIKEAIEADGGRFYENPKDVYSLYRMDPRESDKPRCDVIAGSTCLYALLGDYYNGSCDIYDHIGSFGAWAVYISFPRVDGCDADETLRLRHEIEDGLTAEILEPMHLGQVTGAAGGTQAMYIDLIVYDLEAFAQKAAAWLERYPALAFTLAQFKPGGMEARLSE